MGEHCTGQAPVMSKTGDQAKVAKIHLKGLAHSYLAAPQSADDYALQAIDHTWQHGGAYALLGPSGCGKSTLLNIISGLLRPSEGAVLFDGQDVKLLSPQQRNIAQVFQFPVVYDAMTVEENLAFPLKNMKLPKAQIQAKVAEIAHLLDLEDCLAKKAKNLSADQKQKISMARGLVREDVSAILFDEPLTVIDPNLKWKLRRKLKEIHKQLNITMLYVTHDQLEAATFADEIALMYQGKIVQFGSPQELFERPNHTFVGYFIGSPGMNFIEVDKHQSDVAYQQHAVRLSVEQQKTLRQTRSQNIKLGIRPEFVALQAQASATSFAVALIAHERLGSYQLLTVDFHGLELKLRISEKQPVSEGSLHISFPAQHLKLYIDEYLCGEPVEDEAADSAKGQS